MQNRPATSPTQADPSMGSIALLKVLVARHPYITALFFLVYWIALLLTLGRLLVPIYTSIHIPFLPFETINEFLLALIVALPIAVLKWWPETGFTRGINGRGVLICLLPIVLIAGPALLGVIEVAGQASGFILVTALTLALLVGFTEEGMFRGLIVSSLLPKGIWPAVLLSALFFAGTHLVNLLSDASWGYVFGQMVLAFGTGVLFAALRLRTGSIWPCIVLHAARDIAGLILFGVNPAMMTSTPSDASNIVNGVFCLLYLLIAFVLLRPSQVRKLEIAYGLVRQPVAALVGNSSLPYAGPPPYHQEYTPYPTYGNYPTPTNNPAYGQQTLPTGVAPQPYPGEVSYQEYMSPAAYREPPSPEVPTSAPPNDGMRQE